MALMEELPVPLASVKVVLADTALVPWDAGTFGSQSTPQMVPQIHIVWVWILAVMAGIAVLGILACHFYVLCRITRRIPVWLAGFLWLYTFIMGIGVLANYVYAWGNSDDLKLSRKIFWLCKLSISSSTQSIVAIAIS